MPGPGIACSGGYAWFKRRYQVSLRQPFRLNCDNAVRRAFSAAKQQYGAPRLAAEQPEYNVKTIAVSQHRQGLRAKASREFSRGLAVTSGRAVSKITSG